jgi:hypothetical protein
MEIIVPPKRYSTGERDKAMERELRLGFEWYKARERRRELRAAEDAKMHAAVKKKDSALGRCVATMPHWEFFRLVQKYGHKEVHSKGFMQYFQKKFPHLAPNKL